MEHRSFGSTWLARRAVQRPGLWLFGVLSLTLALAAGLPRLELVTEGSALHPEGNPIVEASEADRFRFGEPRQVVLLIACQARDPAATGCLATREGFRFLHRVHTEIETLSAVRGDGVVSLAGLLRVAKEGVSLTIARDLDDVPDDDTAFAALLSRVRAHPLTNGLLLSEDGRFASLFVPLAENRPVSELVDELEQWRAALDAPGYDLQLTGPEVAEATLGRIVLRDLRALIPVMVVVVSGLLFLTFRTAAGVLIPMIEAGIVLSWTFGAMGWLSIPITLVTTILPVVLMAMSITDEIHLLERVRDQSPSLARGDAVVNALAEVGRPIVMTSLTTAVGFLSFQSASLQPLRDFGLFTAFGILVAMALSFTFIPALWVILPEAWSTRRGALPAVPDLGLDRLARASVARPAVALTAGLALLCAALPGLFLLRVQDSWVDNFDPDSAIARAERAWNDAFWGSYRYDVVFEATPDFFYSSAGTALLEDFEKIAREAPFVGGVESHLLLLGEVARAMGEDLPLSRLPELAVADLAILAEMSAERLSLRRLLTDSGDAARVRLYVNSPDYAKAISLRDHLARRLGSFAMPDFVEVHASGDLPVAIEVVGEVVRNQLRSIGWTLLLVTLVILAFFARGRAGLIAMIPVTAATVMLFGGMGFLGVPLGIATSMFAALTVGVGVDFGIHFLHGYRRARGAGHADRAALRITIDRTGSALRWNALVLALGFLVLSVSNLKPNHSLGFLLAAAMIACYAATMLFLPRLARYTAIGILLLALGGAAPAAHADRGPCGRPPDPAARAIMAGIERDQRSRTRIVQMKLHTEYPTGHGLARYYEENPETKILWAVFDTDGLETWTVYVFSGPGRMAGTTLLIRDRVDTLEGDAMWLYLRAFESFQRLESTTRRRTVVPGTSLTYEDAKGFISLDKYRFSFSKPLDPSADTALILACPATPLLSRDLGYRSLRVVVDVRKRFVREVHYRDLAGKPLKRYLVLQDQQVGTLWVPRQVLLEHLANGTRTPIEYRSWLPDRAPPKDLHAPSVASEPFRERLVRYLETQGLGALIRAELAAADASVQRWEQKWGSQREGGDVEPAVDPE